MFASLKRLPFEEKNQRFFTYGLVKVLARPQCKCISCRPSISYYFKKSLTGLRNGKAFEVFVSQQNFILNLEVRRLEC
jgi:hypothetical protein